MSESVSPPTFATRKRPIGITLLAILAAMGCILAIVLTIFPPASPLQWVFALYAILDAGIIYGYLRGPEWGSKLALIGAAADILPCAVVLVILAATGAALLTYLPISVWLILLPLPAIGVFTIWYLSSGDAEDWFE